MFLGWQYIGPKTQNPNRTCITPGLSRHGVHAECYITWKSASREAIVPCVDTYSISVHVYGPQEDEQKLLFLQELRDVRSLCAGSWLIAGGFNLIYQASDNNKTTLDRVMIGIFRCFLDDTKCKEIPLWGHKFTWSNERPSPTLVCLEFGSGF